METKVLSRLEPKARPFGFSKEELMTVCKSIANGFSSEEEATEEAIDAKIEAYLPILKLSQSAANRSFERMKAQFEKNNPPKVNEPDPKPDPAPDPKPDPKPADEMPEWFRSFKEQYDKDKKDTTERFSAMAAAKANEGFMAKVNEGLKDVDPKFYIRELKGRTFKTQEEADTYVSEVVEDWTAFCSEKNIKAMKDVVPPGGGENNEKVDKFVTERTEARKAEETKSAIKGL